MWHMIVITFFFLNILFKNNFICHSDNKKLKYEILGSNDLNRNGNCDVNLISFCKWLFSKFDRGWEDLCSSHGENRQ